MFVCLCVCCSWLQPESYVDPQQTVVLLNNADRTTATLYCNVPVTLTIVTRDQYATTASVQNLKVRSLRTTPQSTYAIKAAVPHVKVRMFHSLRTTPQSTYAITAAVPHLKVCTLPQPPYHTSKYVRFTVALPHLKVRTFHVWFLVVVSSLLTL